MSTNNSSKVSQLASVRLASVQQRNRAGELCDVPDRSERFLSSNSDWFFQTREGAIEGPFKDRNHASRALSEFMEFLSMATPRMSI